MNIIARILSGAVLGWGSIAKEIEDDFAKVKSALPASALGDVSLMQSNLKQAASNALAALDTTAIVYAPQLAVGVEQFADNALASLTGGLSVPLNPLLNEGIDQIVSHGVAALQAWALKSKAAAAPPPFPAPSPLGADVSKLALGSGVVAG